MKKPTISYSGVQPAPHLMFSGKPRRFEGIAGIKYPDITIPIKISVLRNNYISTKEASIILQCASNAAIKCLKRQRTSPISIPRKTGGLMFYWLRADVLACAATKSPIMHEDDLKGYIDITEAGIMLGVARTSVQRIVERGLLHCRAVRVQSAQGWRKRSFFVKASVIMLADKIKIKNKSAELSALREQQS